MSDREARQAADAPDDAGPGSAAAGSRLPDPFPAGDRLLAAYLTDDLTLAGGSQRLSHLLAADAPSAPPGGLDLMRRLVGASAEAVADAIGRLAPGRPPVTCDGVLTDSAGHCHPVAWQFELADPALAAHCRVIGLGSEQSAAGRVNEERAAVEEMLRLAGDSENIEALVQTVAVFLRNWSGCDAVGVRLRRDSECPFAATIGLPSGLVAAENRIRVVSSDGLPACGPDGAPLFECLCGQVLGGQFDGSGEMTTAFGSFWTADTNLLETEPPAWLAGVELRGRCFREGTRSLALVPLRVRDDILGLALFNDPRPGLMNPDLVAFLERICGHVAVAVAERLAVNRLRHSEQELRTLLETIGDAVIVTDPAANLLFANLEAVELAGYASLDAMLAAGPAWQEQVVLRPAEQPAGEPIRPWAAPVARRQMVEVVRPGLAEPRSAWLRTVPVNGPEGRLERLITRLEDRTDVAVAEAALADSEARYRSLLDHLPCSVLVVQDGRYVYGNPAACRYLGFPDLAALAGTLAFDTIDPSYHELILQRMQRTAAGLTNGPLNLVLRRPDGSTVTLESNSAPFSHEGRPASLVIGVDVSERQAAQTALQQERNLLDAVLERTETQFAYVDREFRFVLVNQAYCAGMRHTKEQLIGQGHFDLFPDDAVEAIFRQVLESGEAVSYVARPYVFADQPERGVTYWDWTLIPVKAADGTVQGLVLSATETTDRVRQHEALRRSERTLRAFFEAIPESAILFAPDGTVLRCNAVLGRRIGFAGEDLTGRHMRELLPPNVVEPRLARLAEVVATRQPVEFEDRHGERTVSHHLVPILNAAGEVEAVAAFAVDLTSQRRREDALRESEARFRLLADSAPIMIWMSDALGNCTWFNQRWLEFTGADEEDLLGSGWAESVHPDDRLWMQQTFEAAVVTRGDYKVQYRLRRCDGTYRWVEERGVPRDTPEGRYLGFIGTTQDITERREAELALRRSEEKYRALFENSSLGIFRATPGGELLEANPAMATMLGFDSPGALLAAQAGPDGRRICLLEAHGPEVLPELVAAGGFARFEHRCRRRDSKQWDASLHLRAVLDERGEVDSLEGIVEDISERKRSEQALLRASRLEATATLAGGIAHDFNNLMVAVLGNAELLRTSVGTLSGQTLLDEIAEAAQRAGELAHQMLAFARGGRYDVRRLDLANIVNDVLHGGGSDRLELTRATVATVPDLWPVQGDRSQLHQVVNHLWTNALEAIGPSGQVEFRLGNCTLGRPLAWADGELPPGQYVQLTVSDNGLGMSREVAQRAFEPFFSTKFVGRGLGLSVVYGVMSSHGGAVQLDTTEGRGTTVRIYLPADQSSIAAASPTPAALPTGTETILVVDDDMAVAKVLCRILEPLGYTVLTAADPAAALRLVRTDRRPIHLALLDLGLPAMSGDRLFGLLREARPDMAILICTGYDLEETGEELLGSGAAGYVHKPFRTADLARSIRAALDR